MTGIRIGIIGVGGAGQAHAMRFQENPHVGQVIGFDIKPIETPDAEMVYELDPFFDGVDAVSVCTPDHHHLEYIVAAFERGKHVLVEKPMVASEKEAIELEGIVARYPQLTFAVHHQMRYVPAFEKAKQLIDCGELGQVFYVEANYWHDMRERSVQFDDWRVREPGQSIVFGAACHPLDLILHLLGDTPSEVETLASKNAYPEYVRNYTSATTALKFSNGVVAKSNTNYCVRFPQFNNLIVLGERGSYIDGVLCLGDKFRLFPEVMNFGHGLKGKRNRKALERLIDSGLFRVNPMTVYLHEEACFRIVNNFVDALRGEARPLVGLEDGRRVIRLCERIERQAVDNVATGSIEAERGAGTA